MYAPALGRERLMIHDVSLLHDTTLAEAFYIKYWLSLSSHVEYLRRRPSLGMGVVVVNQIKYSTYTFDLPPACWPGPDHDRYRLVIPKAKGRAIRYSTGTLPIVRRHRDLHYNALFREETFGIVRSGPLRITACVCFSCKL
jgi:hypothetical protein